VVKQPSGGAQGSWQSWQSISSHDIGRMFVPENCCVVLLTCQPLLLCP